MTAELRALNARFIHNFITNDVPSHDAIPVSYTHLTLPTIYSV